MYCPVPRRVLGITVLFWVAVMSSTPFVVIMTLSGVAYFVQFSLLARLKVIVPVSSAIAWPQ